MGECRVGRLERVDLRSVWPRERHDFVPWLARPDNLALLGEAAGLRLEGARLEWPIGGLRADLLCREAPGGSSVVIEAQLGLSDHRHLGQILAYASGFRACAAIWLAERFREVHCASIDRLNGVEGMRCFGLEIEMWRIGRSDPAPRFAVVAGPGDEAPGPRQAQRVRPIRGAISRPARRSK